MMAGMEMMATSIASLDAALGGGLLPGNVYEVYGPPNCGKSIFSFLLSSVVADSGNKVIFMDTKNSFHAERTLCFTKDPENVPVLGNITVYKVKDISGLLNTLDEFKASPGKLDKVKLLIIDSVTMVVYAGVKEKSGWRQFTDAIMNRLEELATRFGLVVIAVNLAVREFENQSYKRAMGNHWMSRVRNSLRFEKTTEQSKVTVCVDRMLGVDVIDKKQLVLIIESHRVYCTDDVME